MLSHPPQHALHPSIHPFIPEPLLQSSEMLAVSSTLLTSAPWVIQALLPRKPFWKTPTHPSKPDLGIPCLTSASQRPRSCLIWLVATSWPWLLLDSAYNTPLSFISCSFRHHSLQGAAQTPPLVESPLTSFSRISPLWLTPGVWGPLRTLSTSCLVSWPPCELFGQKEERAFPWHLAQC